MSNLIIAPTQTPQEQAVENAKVEKARIEAPGTDRDTWKFNVAYREMADFLGIHEPEVLDEDIAKKIDFIRDFTQEKEEVDAKLKIKTIMNDLGVHMKGKELVNHLYKFTRLAQERTRIEKELSLLVEKQQNVTNSQGERPAEH